MDKIEYQDIEQRFIKFYNEIKKRNSTLTDLTFTITTYGNENTEMHGFVHLGGECEPFRSFDCLISVIPDKEILFRKFN